MDVPPSPADRPPPDSDALAAQDAPTPPPRRSAATADFGPGLRRTLRLTTVVFVVALGLVLLDVLAGVRLPAAVRPALPWALVGATVAGITLLVGALGTPKRPSR